MTYVVIPQPKFFHKMEEGELVWLWNYSSEQPEMAMLLDTYEHQGFSNEKWQSLTHEEQREIQKKSSSIRVLIGEKVIKVERKLLFTHKNLCRPPNIMDWWNRASDSDLKISRVRPKPSKKENLKMLKRQNAKPNNLRKR